MTIIDRDTQKIDGMRSEYELRGYHFPLASLRLTRSDTDRGRTPLVIVACGSFNPLSYLHLRMFEMAKDWATKQSGKFVVIGSYLSPVGDAYGKKDLEKGSHRIKMCELGVNSLDSKIMVDPWEAIQSEYQKTALVLDHFNYELNTRLGGFDDGSGVKKKIQVMLLGGADILESFSQPGVWSPVDLNHILCDYGAIIIEREGTDLDRVIGNLDPIWKQHVFPINQRIRNDVSSTKIRSFRRDDLSIRYLLPEPIIDYIDEQNLYPPLSKLAVKPPSPDQTQLTEAYPRDSIP